MKTTRRWAAHPARLMVLALGWAVTPHANALYVEMFAIGDFVPGASGGCGGGDRSSWPGMAQAWYDEMGSRGHFKAGKFVDGNMTVRRFCDPTTYHASCTDFHPHVDWADAAIIATHGFDAGNRWGGSMRYPWNGACAVEAGSGSNMVRWGDSWLMFGHLSSCYSMNDNYLPGMRVAMQDTGTSSSRRAHQLDGFHGLMWISSSFNGNYRDTASDGHSVSVAYSWVTNHYKNNDFECAWYDPFGWLGTCRDQCPIAYAIGSSNADALFRLNHERYNWTFSDPTSNSYYAYMYYAGCHPAGKGPFNP
ncbi:MAG: hypothetical protein KIT73_05345 [Burkholderiales bacterium]|nr:hypothetical protein [Burkholderiales bacterium]